MFFTDTRYEARRLTAVAVNRGIALGFAFDFACNPPISHPSTLTETKTPPSFVKVGGWISPLAPSFFKGKGLGMHSAFKHSAEVA